MTNAETREALDMAIKALEAQEWIPVSERLPENEYVLISKKPSKISGDKWRVTIAIRMADPRSKKVQWRDIGFGIIPDDKILAWKPLPEPYKEDENEQPEQAVKDCRNCKHGNYNDHLGTHFCYNPNECTEWNLWEPITQPERFEIVYGSEKGGKNGM